MRYTPLIFGSLTLQQELMMSLLDVRPQPFVLLPQGLLLLPPDALATHDQHYRLVPRHFAVRRATRRFLLPLALQ